MVEVYPGHSGCYSFSTRIHLGDGSPAARRQNGSSGSSVSGKRNKRQRSWGLQKARALGRNYRCSCPRPPSWHRQARSRGTGCAFLCFFPS